MTEHTPIPWRKDDTDEACFVIPRNDLNTVQIVCVLGEHSEVADAQDYANAAFIVHAVNNHDALVEVLRGLLGGIEAEANGNVGTLRTAQKKARAAFVKAKEH